MLIKDICYARCPAASVGTELTYGLLTKLSLLAHSYGCCLILFNRLSLDLRLSLSAARCHLLLFIVSCFPLTSAACCRKLVYIRAAGPLTVTVLSIAICNIFHLSRAPANIKVVGTVPAVRTLWHPSILRSSNL